MDSTDPRLQNAELARLSRVKQRTPYDAAAIGPELISFFKVSVEKRNAKFSKIADVWMKLVPQVLADHKRAGELQPRHAGGGR